jgi:hypothetical protein
MGNTRHFPKINRQWRKWRALAKSLRTFWLDVLNMSTILELKSFMTVRTDIQLNLESNTWIAQNKNVVHVQYLWAEFFPDNWYTLIIVYKKPCCEFYRALVYACLKYLLFVLLSKAHFDLILWLEIKLTLFYLEERGVISHPQTKIHQNSILIS